MTFLGLDNTLLTILGIILIVGVIALINSLLERNDKLKNLAKIIWIMFFILLFNMAAATFYLVLNSKQI
jgi:peptidoglycan biosynthesis protein MviN/MurJ (putative lipid II flippase)